MASVIGPANCAIADTAVATVSAYTAAANKLVIK